MLLGNFAMISLSMYGYGFILRVVLCGGRARFSSIPLLRDCIVTFSLKFMIFLVSGSTHILLAKVIEIKISL